jgi:hypothetical protein
MFTITSLSIKAASSLIYVAMVCTVVLHGVVKRSTADVEVSTYHTSPALLVGPKMVEEAVNASSAAVSKEEIYKLDVVESPGVEHMESIVLLEKYKLEKKIENKLFTVYDESPKVEAADDLPVGYFYDEVAENNIKETSSAPIAFSSVGNGGGLSMEEADKAIAEIQQNLETQYSVATKAASDPKEKFSLPVVAEHKPKEKSFVPSDENPAEKSDLLPNMYSESVSEIQLVPLHEIAEKELDKLRFKVDMIAVGDQEARIASTSRLSFEMIWGGSNHHSERPAMMAAVFDKDFISTRFDVSVKEPIKQVPLLTYQLMSALDSGFIPGMTGAMLISLKKVSENLVPFASKDGRVQVGSVLYLDDAGNVVDGTEASYVLLYQLPLGNIFVGFENENKNTTMEIVHILSTEILYIDRPVKENFSQTVTFHIEHLMGRIAQDYNLDLDDWSGQFHGFDFRKVNYNTLEISSPLVWEQADQFVNFKQGESSITLALSSGTPKIDIPSEEFVDKVFVDLGVDDTIHCVLQLNISDKLAQDQKFIIEEIQANLLTHEIKGQTADTSIEEAEFVVLDESGIYQKSDWERPRKVFVTSQGVGEILLNLRLNSGEISMLRSPCAPGSYVVKTL